MLITNVCFVQAKKLAWKLAEQLDLNDMNIIANLDEDTDEIITIARFLPYIKYVGVLNGWGGIFIISHKYTTLLREMSCSSSCECLTISTNLASSYYLVCIYQSNIKPIL